MTLFLSSLCLVFLLGMQQQHVTGGHHGWSFLTNYAIAGAQILFVQAAVASDVLLGVLQLGTGGAIGASLSMVVHRRFIRRRAVIGSEV